MSLTSVVDSKEPIGDDERLGEPEAVSETSSLEIVNYPWCVKGPALLCVLMFTIGSNWATAALSPLKSTLKKELKINNAQYGVIASANSLVNTVLPVIGGIAIDWFGPEWGSMLSSVCVLLGTLVSGIGASRSSYRAMVVGNVVLGLGSNTIESCQSKLYTHWFYGNHLGFVYGIDIAFGRVINTISKATSIPIVERTGWWGWSIWASTLFHRDTFLPFLTFLIVTSEQIPCIMAVVTLLINTAYIFFERRLPKESRLVSGREAAKRMTDANRLEGTRKAWFAAIIAIPAAFWIIALSQLLQAGDVSAYSSIQADLITQTRGSSRLVAGYTSSISQIIPIFVTPMVGALFDRYGRRMYYVSVTALLWILVYVLMGLSLVHPMVPAILASVALSFNAIPFIAAIPLVAPSQKYLGTAFGVWKAFNSAASVIMDVLTGAIQDKTPTGPHIYNNVMYFLIALKAVDVVYGMLYHVLDVRYFGSILRMSEAEKLRDVQRRESEPGSVAKQYPLRRPVKLWTGLGLVVMFALVVTTWVVYLVPVGHTRAKDLMDLRAHLREAASLRVVCGAHVLSFQPSSTPNEDRWFVNAWPFKNGTWKLLAVFDSHGAGTEAVDFVLATLPDEVESALRSEFETAEDLDLSDEIVEEILIRCIRNVDLHIQNGFTALLPPPSEIADLSQKDIEQALQDPNSDEGNPHVEVLRARTGTTALVALVDPKKVIHVASLGDSDAGQNFLPDMACHC
ncbi:MFS transporter [Mycena venus]|uniref:Lysosomal dipeptide transporter MFSD1 n=1 Tax=Mycena venus TaxID=2733690 RepID=A0A8H7CPA1_9AGAR|nr:MFS transporter [Mycena venus]